MTATAPKRQTRPRKGTEPVLKLRHIVIGAALVACVVAGPLLLVRKQVYLRNLAIRRETLTDSLTVGNRVAAELNVEARRLASQHRIERIARESLGMEYPGPHQIVIIEEGHAQEARKSNGGFMAILKQSLGKGRG